VPIEQTAEAIESGDSLDAVAPAVSSDSGMLTGTVVDPQNPGTLHEQGHAAETPNPNCMQSAVVDVNGIPVSPGLARPFAYNPQNRLVGHDGPHALSPSGGAFVQTLAPLAGRVIYTNIQEGQGANALYLVDVGLPSGIVVRYKDLSSVSVRAGQTVKAGDIIGKVRPAGDQRNYVGLHLTLVKGTNYERYKANVRAGRPSPVSYFIDPLGPSSPVRCPGVTLRK
jgi:hypothetical protein